MGRPKVDVVIETTFRLVRLGTAVAIVTYLALTIWERFA